MWLGMVNNLVGIVLSSFHAYKMCIYDIIFVFNINLTAMCAEE